MDLPIRSTVASRPCWLSPSLAIGIHAAFAAAFFAIAPAPPNMPSEPIIEMELVAWNPPEPAAPEPPAQATPAPPTPAQAARAPAASPKVAAPRPAPTVDKPAAIAPTAMPTASAAATEAAGDKTEAADTPAATAQTASSAPPAADSYTPPSGDAAYLSNPKPAYPSLAQRRGWEGVVTLTVAVDENGMPQEVLVKASSGYSVLDRCAIEAVQRWRFVPARRAGRAVAANVEVPVRFGLADQATG